MFLVNRVFNRPSTDVAFYVADPEFRNYYEAKYEGITDSISGDGLRRTFSTTWVDEATWSAYTQDPVCVAHFSARNAYNEANGITSSRETSTI